MSSLVESQPGFVDRRAPRESVSHSSYQGPERRQFRDSHESAAPDIRELADAVDLYKATHRRRFITYAELHNVITSLGYHK